jgi:hypothetical protein
MPSLCFRDSIDNGRTRSHWQIPESLAQNLRDLSDEDRERRDGWNLRGKKDILEG